MYRWRMIEHLRCFILSIWHGCMNINTNLGKWFDVLYVCEVYHLYPPTLWTFCIIKFSFKALLVALKGVVAWWCCPSVAILALSVLIGNLVRMLLLFMVFRSEFTAHFLTGCRKVYSMLWRQWYFYRHVCVMNVVCINVVCINVVCIKPTCVNL